MGALEDPKLSASTDYPRFTTTSSDYVHSLYQETAGEGETEEVLKEMGTYDTTETRWSIPTAPAKTEELVNAVFKVLSSIVRRFVKPATPGVEREVVNTQDVPTCQGKNGKGYRTCPLIMVRAAGPSFEAPKPRRLEEASQEQSTSIGFGGMATYFSVKLESELGSEKEELEEMECYARRIFHAQHSRYHVRSLIVTEKHARLVHSDRSGSQITPPFDIHQHPATLVRLVTGLSSVNECDLGIDDSVRWTIVDGRKEQGTLTTTGKDGKSKTYPIIEEIPIPRDSIRGRATTCWRVRDPDTLEELVVKDSWRPDDRHAEHELLKLVKGIRGVVQMVSCEEDRGQTKTMRCPSTVGRFQNRVFERVVMRSYGKPLEFFQSVLQLLCAIRDAIAGHQRLVEDDIRILHRDVSPHNILLGGEGAPEGDRGILIDLDMAFRATLSRPTVAADFNTGTRIFQSLSVLNSHDPRHGVRAHDYLDDLESFFYLLAYIFLRFRPDGTRVPDKEEGPSLVWEWADDCPSTASGRKSLVFSMGKVGGRALRLVEGTWGDVCGALFKKYRRWVSQVRSTKTALLYKATRGQSVDADPLKTLHARRDEHYAEVLALFDEAIETIKTSPASPTSADGSPTPTAAALVEEPPATLRNSLPSAQAKTLTTPPSTMAKTAPPKPPTLPPTPPPGTPPTPIPAVLEFTPPTTPPRRAPHTASAHTSPLSPSRKRRSEEGEHPESPKAKVRRLSGTGEVASRSR
ncbi:hypothetical protein NMY22_g7501 [Coprinellus aureogranulatus]|nr:hypothetical protein NMY22_g7501 [Coprinellus aureogranulatus]